MSIIYQLPVPAQSITGLGGNPLLEEWKHRDLGGTAKYMQFAWDFLVPIGTPVFAARSGRVYDVKVDSDVQGNPELLEAIYRGNQTGFIDFVTKNPNLMKLIYKERESVKKALYEGNIEKAMWETGQYYYENANRIILEHNDGTYSASIHLGNNGMIVKIGDLVEAGRQIGHSGNSGFSGAPHLHWEVYKPLEGVGPVAAFIEARKESIDAKFDEKSMKELLERASTLLH